MSALDRVAVTERDGGGQLADVLGTPDHLRDALWRVESAALSPREATGGLVVAGMGGSAIAGSLAVAVLGDRASRPITCARDYELPPATSPEATVLCVSYSGETEETLAVYEAAGALGARRVVATTGGRLAAAARADGVHVIGLPGGFQPRAALAYALVATLEVAALCGVGPRLHSEIDVAAAHAEALAGAWGPDGPDDGPAKALARGLHGTIPTVIGAGLTAPVAYRWKTQINENAKRPAFAATLPEFDHNEVCGWADARALAPLSAVFLDDSDLHPRVRRRIELTRAALEPQAAATFVVPCHGASRTERVVSLVLLGDLTSLYLAALAGVDPEAIPIIDRLKEQLAGEYPTGRAPRPVGPSRDQGPS